MTPRAEETALEMRPDDWPAWRGPRGDAVSVDAAAQAGGGAASDRLAQGTPHLR